MKYETDFVLFLFIVNAIIDAQTLKVTDIFSDDMVLQQNINARYGLRERLGLQSQFLYHGRTKNDTLVWLIHRGNGKCLFSLLKQEVLIEYL